MNIREVGRTSVRSEELALRSIMAHPIIPAIPALSNHTESTQIRLTIPIIAYKRRPYEILHLRLDVWQHAN